MTSTWTNAFFAVMLVVYAGCSYEEVAASGSAISGMGTEVDSNVVPAWPEVVSLGNCTGTVISPVHVLSAGHCGAGTRVYLDTPVRSGWGPAARRDFAVVNTSTLSSTVASGRDVQVLLLDRRIRSEGAEGAPVWAVPGATLASSFVATNSHTSVGYGLTCPLPGEGSGIRRWIELAGPYTGWSGDQITLPNNTPCDATYNGPQPGDSGGPLFDANRQIVGVFSGWFTRNGVGTIEWTNVTSINRQWIMNQLSVDFDSDGLPDISDPFPSLASHADADGDGVPDGIDNRPTTPNPMQLDPVRDGGWVAQLVAVVT